MYSTGTTSSSIATQRPVIPGNPAGSMHDYGGGARAATAAGGGYGTMDPNFNNNNPYNGNVMENMKGFDCNTMDGSLLATARANAAAAATGSVTMQQNTGAGYGIQQPNIPVSSAANMQFNNSSYGCMQQSGTNTSGQNFDFQNSGNSTQSSQMQIPIGAQSQMFTNSSDYSKQMGPNSSRMNASMDPNYCADQMANPRRLSTPAMSSNSSQNYLQRSNSYPANSNFDESNQQFSTSGRNPTTSYQDQNFNPNSSQTMRSRSYSTGFAQDTSGSNWSEYNMQSKNSFGGMVGNSVRNMYRGTSAGQTSQQYSTGVTRGIRYPAQRGAYSGTNSEIPGNTYGNTSMQSHFQSGKNMMGINYQNRNSMVSPNAMPYSQSMNQSLQTQRNLGMDSSQTGSNAQKLRHFGPMPNNRASYATSPSQGARSMAQYPSQYDGQVPGGAGMESYSSGGFQGNMSQYPMHNQMRRTMTPAGQSAGSSMVELANAGCTADSNYYNRTKPTFPPHAQQDSASEMYGTHFPNNSQGHFDSMTGSQMPGTYPQGVDAMSAAQTRKNMIFSAELEKLARLSRNPMLDADYPLPSVPDVPPINPQQSIALGGNQQVANFQGTGTHPPMATNTMPPCSEIQQSSGMQQPTGRRSVPNVYNAKMPGTPPTTQQSIIPPNKQMSSMDKGYVSPANSAPPTPIVSQSVTNVQRATPERTTASSAPATPATSNQDTTRQTNSVDPSMNSGSTVPSPSISKTRSPGSIDVKKEDSLQKIVKEKQDEITKANPNHHEYLSDNVPTGQNCIAALSAACRNMIADMDNTMPKPARQSVQSPLGNKSSDTMSIGSMRAPSVGGSVVSGQLTPSSDVSMSSIGHMSGHGASTPLAMHIDNFSSPPSNYGNMPGNMIGNDYQTQYHDFLEQSVPMPLNSKQIGDKLRKPRKRRKSDDFLDCGANQPGVKKRKPRKKSQNPSSVESYETVQSLDNISECTTLSDSHGQFGDEMNCRSASQTPTSVPTSWCSNNPRISNADMNCYGSNHMQHQTHLMDTDQSTQDFLDSVFSPDTTMSNIMQDVADSVMMGHVNPNHQSPTSSYASHHSNNDNASVASFQSQGSLPTPTSQTLTNLDHSHVHSNGPMTNGHRNGHSNNTVSSSGDLVSTSVTTSGDRIDTSSEKSNSEEAHPLEILQAQIQLQRQQFNLSDSRPLPMRDNARKNNNTVRKTGTTVPGEVDVDVLMAEKDSTWYVPSDQTKEPEVPWEQTKKTTATSKGTEVNNQIDRRKQNTQHEKNRRDSLKNSIENLKNALPGDDNISDQTQQSVLMKAHNYIVDMLEKQQKNKVCSEEIESMKMCNIKLEDNITLLKQEYEMLSNLE